MQVLSLQSVFVYITLQNREEKFFCVINTLSFCVFSPPRSSQINDKNKKCTRGKLFLYVVPTIQCCEARV